MLRSMSLVMTLSEVRDGVPLLKVPLLKVPLLKVPLLKVPLLKVPLLGPRQQLIVVLWN